MDVFSALASPITSIANAANSDSWNNGFSNATSDSWQTASSGSQASSYGYSDASSYGYSNNESQNIVYGREASAEDILRAAEANAVQANLWREQALYNSAEAEKNRQYQTQMSNTAYQRAVMDLKKAGLNPILAAMNMGASTPSGATASSGLATAHKANTYAQSEGYSKGHSQSGSSSHSESRSDSSSWSQASGGSHSSSHSEQEGGSRTRTQLAQLLESLGGLMEGTNSGKVAEDKNKGKTYSSGDFTGRNSA